MNDTPQGDGNKNQKYNKYCLYLMIRMNDTPQGDGNSRLFSC